MCEVGLPLVAELLRPVSRQVSNGQGKLCLSTVYLQKINSSLEENVPENMSSSFHLVQGSNAKANWARDLQFLLDLIAGTVALKITPDLINNEQNIVKLSRFENIKILEIHKIDIKRVIGIQRLRSQLEHVTCSHNLENISDLLEKCGGDDSQGNLWSELNKAIFSHNEIRELDNSFESTPWLKVLDLSYNHLTRVEFINNLPNLKYLNISFNKLEKVPKFKGQVCKRLQVLILNNNFIEDLSGLLSLSAVLQLDLSQNCLLDHKNLLSISHLPSLHSLNLQENPIFFHPHHRTIACNHLNKNTATLKFVLDNMPLNKTEKSFAGSLYPISQGSLSSSNHSSQNSIENSLQERQKRIRNVKIGDGSIEIKKKAPVVTPKASSVHLEIKMQMEQLRKRYGESWLHREPGLLVQDLLGFEKSTVLSSTPIETDLENLYLQKADISDVTKSESLPYTTANTDSNQEEYNTASNDADIFKATIPDFEESGISDDDDICEGGEEGIFLATTTSDVQGYDICVVVTASYLSERDVITSKEKARWHVNTVLICAIGDIKSEVRLSFDTLRRDRRSRVYYMEDADNFVKAVNERTLRERIPEQKVVYQCMKCSELFSRSKVSNILDKDNTIVCPKCDSSLVVESV